MFTCFIVTVIPQSRDHVGRWERPQLPRKSRSVGPSRKQTAPRMTGTRHLRSTDGRQGSGRECIQSGHTAAWWGGGGGDVFQTRQPQGPNTQVHSSQQTREDQRLLL